MKKIDVHCHTMKKIDIHCHTTPRKLEDLVVASASLDTIAEKMQEHNIEKTVLLASYFPHKQSGISNYRLYHWIHNRQEFLMFGSLDFEHYFNQGYNELEELAASHALHGIKIYTCYQNIDLQSEKMQRVAQLAEKHTLPLMFHVGYSYSAMRTTGKISIANTITPKDIAEIAQQYPRLPIIIAHMGKPFFDQLIEGVKNTENLYADMSGLIDSKHDRSEIGESLEAIQRFVQECGSKKLLFGSDFPVQT